MISEESESGNDTVSLVPANKENVDTLANLNAVLFPITYQKKFYIDCLACGPYTVMAQLNGSIVAAICCRLETHQDLGVRLYIMTLGVLAPYRRRGIANALLGHALRLAQQDPRIVDTYLHVQEYHVPTGYVGIKSVEKNEYLYVGNPKLDDHIKYVLIFHTGSPKNDQGMLLEIVKFDGYYGIKSKRFGKWLYAGNPKLDKERRHLLMFHEGDPTTDNDMRVGIFGSLVTAMAFKAFASVNG
eukprot:gene13090-15458_t